VLIGDPNAPNGGLAERFDGLNLPSLGISYDGATPSDSFPTDIYTIEYDGYADFPQYPINFLADLNADLGLVDIHSLYLNGGVDGSGPTAEQIANAVLLPGSALDGTADSLTNYYMIDETAPLVSLLPTQLQELLGPDLTYLINLGYGDGSLGYSDTPANVPTPFGLFPDVSLSTLLSTLVTDTEQGFENLMSGTDPYAAAALDPATSSAVAVAAIPAELPTFTDILNGISGAAASLSSFLLQTADLGYALVFDLPSYDATLFLNNLTDPLDAIGLPLAADTGLLTELGGVELELADMAITTAINDVSALAS
jgi:PE-PPE domain